MIGRPYLVHDQHAPVDGGQQADIAQHALIRGDQDLKLVLVLLVNLMPVVIPIEPLVQPDHLTIHLGAADANRTT